MPHIAFVVFILSLFVTAGVAGCDYRLNAGVFGLDTPTLFAVQNGYFKAQNLCVSFQFVNGSVQQFGWLADGTVDIIPTAIDNVANRWVNQGLRITFVGVTDNGAGLDVVGRSDITTWADLATKPIAVDAPDSGLVLDLLWMARQNNVHIDTSKFQIVGGALQRFLALTAGTWTNPATGLTEQVYACMQNPPFTDKLRPGLGIFDKFKNYVHPFVLAGLAVNTAFLEQSCHQEAVTRYLIGINQGLAFARNPANAATVKAGLTAAQALTPAQADAEYAELTDTVAGMNANCLANEQGMAANIVIRNTLGYFNTPVTNANEFVRSRPFGFYDDRFCRAALARQEAHGHHHDDDDDNDDDDHDRK